MEYLIFDCANNELYSRCLHIVTLGACAEVEVPTLSKRWQHHMAEISGGAILPEGAIIPHSPLHTQGLFDKVAGGVVNSTIARAAACGIHKSTGSGQLNELGRGWSKSFMEHTGFVMLQRIVYEDGKEIAPKFGGAKGKLRYLQQWRRTAFQLS